MTLQELLDKLPDGLKPVAAQYGPALITMTTAEIWAWVELMIVGDTAKAFKNVIDKLPTSDKLAMMATNLAKWNDLNAANAAKIALQKEAATAVLRALLAIVLAMVGL